MTKVEPDYLTTAEVAKRMGVHVKTVRRWIAAGRVRVVKVAATVRIAWPLESPERKSGH